ncbi:MAG: glycolate oxidase subunit GlcF [Lautropia sp.]
METHLSPEFADTRAGREAEAILRSCVHCGFCTATCPTYQLLGDELDGPRGRIYLIKQVLEGAPASRSTQQHLDRCLTCRNCETTCPSGVAYGRLVDIGREVVEQRVERPMLERAARWMLREGLTSPAFAPALNLGRALRPLLPGVLAQKVPPREAAGAWPDAVHARKVLMLAGCVQPAMMPNVNAATARVLDAAGIQAVVAPQAGCCGAIRAHLADGERARDDMRRNVDAWWPWIDDGRVDAIVINASGCSVTVKDYGHALADDPAYAERAARVASLARDLAEMLDTLVPALRGRVAPPAAPIAFHPPCTLQHGQQIRGVVESGLRELGFDLRIPTQDAHLCCGSAGTYSVLQPELAGRLRDRKLEHLGALAPAAIVSANIGCIQHLRSGTRTPVRHWIELLDDAITAGAPMPIPST